VDVAGRKFLTLKADVGACHGAGVRFQVLLDGNLAQDTQVIGFGAVQPISVDVANAREVVLRALKGGSNTGGEAGWGYARFVQAGAEDPLEEPPPLLQSAAEANAALFLAEVHSRLEQKELAQHWYQKAVEWMDNNKDEGEKLGRFREEAEALLKSPSGVGPTQEVPKEKP
jgi:hypothetical protein